MKQISTFTGAGVFCLTLLGMLAQAQITSSPAPIPSSANPGILQPPSPVYSCATPPAGILGWWKGDGDTVDVVAGNNGVGVNNGYTNGEVGQAFSFDPEVVGGYTGVQIADLPQYVLTNSLSIEGWIRPRGDGYIIFWRGDNRPGLDPYSLSMQGNNTISFNITDADGNGAAVATTLNYGDWTHVAATLDGSTGTMSIYTNGVLASQTNTIIRPFGQLIAGDSPGVGIGNLNDGQNNFPFLGDIDEIALYDRALSPVEITAIYNAGTEGKCLVGFAPVIEDPPTNQTVLAGGSASLSVTASSGSPLQYQWMFLDQIIPGATNATLNLTNLHASQAGAYTVTVTDPSGLSNSVGAVIFVLPDEALVYDYSGAESTVTLGDESNYYYSGQMFFLPATTNGTFVGWAKINGIKQYWVSAFSDYQVVNVPGSAGRSYTVFGKAGPDLDSNNFIHIWSYLHTGKNEELPAGRRIKVLFPKTMSGDETHVYPGQTGNLILSQTSSTYAFSQADTEAANNGGETMTDLVNALTAKLRSAGYQAKP